MRCPLVGSGWGKSAKEEVGMATEMRSLISSVLLIVSVCTSLRLAVADPEISTVWSGCGISGKYEYRIGSAVQLNLNKVLESLVRNVYPSGFNTSSIVVEGANSNSTVYGLVQCRGDLDSSDCKQCASTAKAELVEGCHNTSGFIQLDHVFHKRTKHIDTRYHYIRELVNDKEIKLCFCNSKEQLADIFTKALGKDIFEFQRQSLGICDANYAVNV